MGMSMGFLALCFWVDPWGEVWGLCKTTKSLEMIEELVISFNF